MALAKSDYKLGKCSWCGERGDVFRDNSRCDDCDSNVCRCSICKQDYHYENTCRHIFQNREFEWCGSGVGMYEDMIRPPLFKMLTLMPEGFARDLRTAILSGKFYTFFVAPMIGPGGSLELHGMPRPDGVSRLFWGDAMLKLGEGPAAEETADGYRWLASLYQGDTMEANRATVALIDEWLIPTVVSPFRKLRRT